MFSIFAFEIAVCATTEGGEDAILEQPTSLPKPASKTCDGTTKPTADNEKYIQFILNIVLI